jgi:hypothetical protein
MIMFFLVFFSTLAFSTLPYQFYRKWAMQNFSHLCYFVMIFQLYLIILRRAAKEGNAETIE